MDKLPEKVIVSICKHLPQSDLMRVARVCKLFNEIIWKFNMAKHLHVNEKNDESSSLKGKYSQATIRGYNPTVHQKVFEKLGDGLTSLKFSQFELNNVDIVKILQSTPNVKNLTFDYIRLDKEDISTETQLPTLTGVSILFNESDPNIFRALKNVTMTKVEIKLYGDTPWSNFADFAKMMKLQKNLTSFSVSGAYETNLFLISLGNCNYKLKEFSIENCDFEEWENLESYLAEHAESLEKLVIRDMPRWNPTTTISQCRSLKSLEIKLTEVENIEELPSVEELLLDPATPALASKFPNTKRLFISQGSPEVCHAVSSSMTKLEDIEIKFGGLAGLEVPSLKKLKLSSLDGPISEAFFTTHKKIEELQFFHVFNIDDALLEAITTNLSNLRVLKITGDCHLTSRAFTIISDHCKNLETFEMAKWNQKFKQDDWKCLNNLESLKVYQENLN